MDDSTQTSPLPTSAGECGTASRARVTIVLLTHNCSDWLGRTLAELRGVDAPVIAVDNASTDGTLELLGRDPSLDVIPLRGNVGAAARNVGLRASSTPYVAFCDDDGWYEPKGLDLAADLFDRHPELGLVNARILVGPQETLDPISAEMAASPLPDRHGIPGRVLLGFMGGACIVRREAYEDVGGYDPRFFLGGEEETLAYKLARRGWQMRYVEEVVMHHHGSGVNAPRLRHYGVRNTLVNAWLHRPWRSALRWTWFIARTTPLERGLLRGLAMTVASVPWILRERSPIPADLDAQFTVLDQRRQAATQGRSRAQDAVW